MYRLVIILTFVFSFIASTYAQRAKHDHEGKCSHASHAKILSQSGFQVNPLLEQYDVTFYFLDINIENNTTYVSGNVTIEADIVANHMDTFMLDLVTAHNVDSVIINGVNTNFTHTADELMVFPNPPLYLGGTITARVYYSGNSGGGSFFSGISTDYNSPYGKNVTWTLSEPFNARQWWPCKQDLMDKADSVWIFITTNSSNMAGSNGLLTATTAMPNNKTRYEWKSNYPIAYYLISVAVSDYMDYSIYAHPAGLQDSILIQNFIYDHPACLSNYKNDIDETADFIELFSDLYGMYPFWEEKYGHCLSEIGGGMEHQTMTTQGTFNFDLTVHELGHSWFGNNVTCATWSDIWINEGFATYTEYLATENIKGTAAAYSWMVGNHNYVESQPYGSVYIPPADAIPGNEWRIFNGRLSYEKGASIIHMIRFEMQNDSLFFETLRTFQQIFGDSVATGLDFMQVANNISGLNFTDFFDQWYFGQGYPTHDIIWNQESNIMTFSVYQTASWPSTTPFFKMLLELKLQTTMGDTLIQVYLASNNQVFTVPVSGTVTNVILDPNEWILGQTGNIVVGIDENVNEISFFISPNPVTDQLNLRFTNVLTNDIIIDIFDITGTIVHTETVMQQNSSIYLGSLSKGTYILRPRNHSSSLPRKFIKL